MKKLTSEELQALIREAETMKSQGRINISRLSRAYGLSDTRLKKLLSEEGVIAGYVDPQKKWEESVLARIPDEALLRDAWESSKELDGRGVLRPSSERASLQLGCGYEEAKVWYRHLGLVQGRGTHQSVDEDEIVRLYTEEKRTIAEIARQLKVGEGLVTGRLKKRGFEVESNYRSRWTGVESLSVREKISKSKTGVPRSLESVETQKRSVADRNAHLGLISKGTCPVCETTFTFYTKYPKSTCGNKKCISTYQPFLDKRPATSEKTRATNLVKYGVENVSQTAMSKLAYEVLSSKESFLNYLGDRTEVTTVGLGQELGCSEYPVYSRLKEWDLWSLVTTGTSSAELQLVEYFEEKGVVLRKNRSLLVPASGRKGAREIDLYSPEHQIGIEFNGDYWHGTWKDNAPAHSKHPSYHQKKTQLADEKGISLYHIFEYEWNDPEKKTRILNQLRNLFGLNEKTIGARKCQIVEVSPTEKNEFLELNHVQGKDTSTVKLGLTYEDELVAIMTFVRPRFSKKYQWELSRFCSKSGVSVPGGASRLFKHFVKSYSPESIVSYSNAAKTRGGLYQKLGFEYQHWSDPNYVWTDGNGSTLPRYQTQMKNEVQTMESRGYWRVFDCGSKVWVWTNPDSVPHPFTLSKVTDPEGVPSDCRNLHGND